MEKRYVKELNESLDLMRRMGEDVKLFEIKSNQEELKITDYFNISSITKEEIKSIANDMRVFLQGRGFGSSIFFNGDTVITETSQKTVPYEELRKELVKLGFQDWQVNSEVYANEIKVIILYADIAMNTELIVKEMLSYGWTKSRISKPMIIHEVPCRVMDFDPIEQPTVTELVHQYKYIYHSTPTVNVDSILNSGIQARSDNDYLDYPPRVHFMKGDIKKIDAAYLIWQLFNANKKNFKGDYTVLRIKTSSVPETIDFYYDPRYPMGIFTKETVPSFGVNIFAKIKLLNKNKYCNEQLELVALNDTMAD